MVKICYTDSQGREYHLETEAGLSLMEVAHANAVAGVIAECGGACACATCHVYIESPWLKRLPSMDEIEDTMLDTAVNRQANSRLSCQVIVSENLDGLRVLVADNFQ